MLNFSNKEQSKVDNLLVLPLFIALLSAWSAPSYAASNIELSDSRVITLEQQEPLDNITQSKAKPTLASIRSRYKTKVKVKSDAKQPLPKPPAHLFKKVSYQSNAMRLPAFVTPDPADNKQHPAIVWITGGESNTLGDFWQMNARDNDQAASPYRDAGMIMMFPTLRGGNTNSGFIEYNYGEVDDVIAAAKYLATLPYVDSERIYLGGHSTGGTLALLVSEVVSSTDPNLFKEVISFGATRKTLLHEFDNKSEFGLRAPTLWTQDIKIPTWIIEGEHDSNYGDLDALCASSQNPQLHCEFIPNHDHFSVLYPVNKIIAQQIINDRPINIKASPF